MFWRSYSLFLLVVIATVAMVTVQPVCCRSSSAIRTLNSKLNLLRRKVTNDIDELKFEVLDMKIHIEELVAVANASTASTGSFISADGVDVGKMELKYLELEDQIRNIAKTQKDTEEENSELQKTVAEMPSEQTIVDMKADMSKLFQQVQDMDVKLNECSNENSAMENDMATFIKAMKRAFMDEKAHTMKALKQLEAKIENIEVMAPVATTIEPDYALVDDDDNADVLEMISELDTKLIMLSGNTSALQAMTGELKRNALKMEGKLNTCCAAKPIGGAGASPGIRPAVTPGSPAVVGESVTMKPGGPLIKPIFGTALRKYITLGSRVVRGADWAWRNQDGGGPGTVDGWYGGAGPGSMQVMVSWDNGETKRANYRIGAYGKYDLYLLADQA